MASDMRRENCDWRRCARYARWITVAARHAPDPYDSASRCAAEVFVAVLAALCCGYSHM